MGAIIRGVEFCFQALILHYPSSASSNDSGASMQTSFIGGGVMAEAIFSRALAGHVLTSSEVCVADPVAERRDYLSKIYSVAVTDNNLEAVTNAELVVLSVKPQQFPRVATELKGKLRSHQTLLSIIAGLTVPSITAGLKHGSVIRVMPNTPSQIGQGMSVWMATSAVPEATLSTAKALLSVLGQEWYVADEHYLDMATALSGSGPAYVFAFIESLVEAGVYMGMGREMATALVIQTVQGSAQLAKETGESPALLRERVTSPGGTTAEALRALESRGFRSIILEAVVAAHQKARELGAQ
jgi:pyrroline-5-carboxylate reductase